MFMTAAGFVILILLGLLGLWLIVEIGSFPGKKARERGHPQAEAINVLGWLGLLLVGVGWVVAVVWAYTKPIFAPVATDSLAAQAQAVETPSEEAS